MLSITLFAKEIAINSFTNLLFLGKNDKGEIKDFRTGLYGNYEKNKLSLNSYLGLGFQRNESERKRNN